MALSFYIALYDIGDSTTYHWALIAAEPGTNLKRDPVHMFQIVTAQPDLQTLSPSSGSGSPSPSDSESGPPHAKEDARLIEDGYTAQHGPALLLGPESNRASRFICLVRLPKLATTLPSLTDFMCAQAPGRRDTPLLQVPWGRWECSQWAIRALKGLIDEGWAVGEAKNSFFTAPAAQRGFWGQMLQVAGTKCAHDVLARRNNDTRLESSEAQGEEESGEEGVGVVSLEGSGIKL
ncbi:hypothetical protein D9611_005164 [Ephemerocybe angulata]|uniref:Uncharacterized protein n=1 Tax=Ephemerocybe angulata TaxID=980116 RepID=A0A8H5C0I9_9AGAR|nr:hypothetical protein D9611_005164 [Tulosesus angulatus]